MAGVPTPTADPARAGTWTLAPPTGACVDAALAVFAVTATVMAVSAITVIINRATIFRFTLSSPLSSCGVGCHRFLKEIFKRAKRRRGSLSVVV
jgi:hypothetical protein